jgi:lipoate-protein ligase A
MPPANIVRGAAERRSSGPWCVRRRSRCDATPGWCCGSTGAMMPAVNMARDAALLEQGPPRRDGRDPEVVHVLRPPGCTLGHAQDPARELDLERLRANGVTWAVRPTGGRAIWHDEEWTFSLVTPLTPEGLARRHRSPTNAPHACWRMHCRTSVSRLDSPGHRAAWVPRRARRGPRRHASPRPLAMSW